MTTSSPPPIPATYALTGRASEGHTRQDYRDVVRAWVHDQLQAAGVDYRSHYHVGGAPTRDIYAGLLHLDLLDLALLGLHSPAQAPRPLALPLHSGAGHAVYWTRAQQGEVARLAARIYAEVVQAVDHVWEEIERHVAVMLDASAERAARTAAWATVRRLHTPADEATRRANLDAAVAAVRARDLPPETDLAAYRGVHADRLRAAAERHLRWLLGPAARAVSSLEATAENAVEVHARRGVIRIGRAADAAAVRVAYTSAVAAVEAVHVRTSPRWRVLAGAGTPTQIHVPRNAPLALLPVRTAAPPVRAAVLEAWSPPEEAGQPETAPAVLIEEAVSSDPAALRATVSRGASIGIDRLTLDWIAAAPSAAVTVTATARNVDGPHRISVTVPVPFDPED